MLSSYAPSSPYLKGVFPNDLVHAGFIDDGAIVAEVVGVIALAAVEGVHAVLAVQVVVAVSADQRVLAAAAEQGVVAAPAVDLVVVDCSPGM